MTTPKPIHSTILRRGSLPLLVFVLGLMGCNTTETPPTGGGSNSGGSTATGGAPTEGGTAGTGGTTPTTDCGGPGQICCPGNGCTGGGCCVSGRCVSEGSSCAPLAGTCAQGRCGTCGGVAETCCAGSTCTAGETVCSSNVCMACGRSTGDPCCNTSPLSGTGSRPTCMGSGLICDTGRSVCVPCGGVGDVCCANQACTGGSCCYYGQCVPDGGACQHVDAANGTVHADGTCRQGVCSGCGAPNQQCCAQMCNLGAVCLISLDRCYRCGNVTDRCCKGLYGEAPCAAGSVCDDPDSDEAYCVKCGGPGQACCAGNQCSSGCCYGGKCLLEGTTCTNGTETLGTCQSGRCACGGAGEACCYSTPNAEGACSDASLGCDPGTTLTNGTCAACGREGEVCCAGQTCTQSGTVCSADHQCVACGTDGQPCCDNDTCATGNNCIAGTCRACGGADQTCCAGNTCDDGTLVCQNPGYCVTCGINGSPCCPGSRCNEAKAVCSMGYCTPCGGPGDECCPGNLCDGGCCTSYRRSEQYAPICVGLGAACYPDTNWICTLSGSCSAGVGQSCGRDGEACCQVGAATADQYFCSKLATQCTTRNSCSLCGGQGQPCCVPRTASREVLLRGCAAPYACNASSGVCE